jgi:hypothetical protein
MSEETEKTPSQAVALRPQRLVVQSPVAIMDTARFEHLGRVATVMANAQIMPDSLTHVDGDPKKDFLPFEVIQARAFLLASFADRTGMDPQAVAQATSFIYGRMMPEGKLVNAAIQNALGYEFETEIGAWDVKKNAFVAGEPGEGKHLAVRVIAVDETGEIICNKNGTPKSVEGYVAGWETTKAGSPWSAPSGWRRMLHNRGVREWARTYKPGVMLGVYTPEDRWEDEEAGNAPPPRSRKMDLSAKLAGNQNGGEGFDREGIEATINGATEAPHDPETDEVIDAEVEEPAGLPPPTARDEINGPAPRDVVYMLAGDPVSDAGRVPTYKNGEKHSNCGEKGAADLARYTMHPTPLETPTAEDDDGFPGDKPASQVGETVAAETVSAEEIAAEWEPLERHEGPAPRGVEYTLATDEDIGEDDRVQAYEDGEPTRRVALRDFVTLPEYEEHPEPATEDEDPPEGTIFDALLNETTWEAVKKLLPGLYKQMTDQGMSWPDQEEVRRQIWGTVILGHLRDKHGFEVKPAADVSLYHLWRATQAGPEGAATIKDIFAKVEETAAFKAMPKDSQERIRGITDATCKDIGG